MAHLHAHHVTPRVVLEAANRETALRGVESGMGAMYVIDDPVHFITHPNITYLSFRDSVMTEEVNLALLHNYNAPLGDTGKALWDLIIHEYARIVEKYQ